MRSLERSGQANAVLEEFKAKVASREIRVVVVGAGYVGLPLAIEQAKAGFLVSAYDLDEEKVELLRHGVSYIPDVPSSDVKEQIDAGRFTASTDAAVLMDADVVVVCVPTPVTSTKDPDMTFILGATQQIARSLHRGQLIVLESTTYPGTTDEFMLPILQSTGNRVGQDFFLAFSPERVDPGNQRFNTRNTTKVMGGVTQDCLRASLAFYQETIDTVVPVSSTRVAELAKLFENTYRAVNIALVNELALLSDRMGLSVWEVLDAAGTKPFGIQSFYPGPGVGGHCIPLDPHYLSWKAREYDFTTRIVDLATEINRSMPYHTVDRIHRVLGTVGKALRGSQVLILGAAYKKDIDDYRESPSLKLILLLEQEGATVVYNDPFVPHIHPHPEFPQSMESVPLSDDLWRTVDLAVVVTNHSVYNWPEVCSKAKLVFDTRNATKGLVATNIFRL